MTIKRLRNPELLAASARLGGPDRVFSFLARPVEADRLSRSRQYVRLVVARAARRGHAAASTATTSSSSSTPSASGR